MKLVFNRSLLQTIFYSNFFSFLSHSFYCSRSCCPQCFRDHWLPFPYSLFSKIALPLLSTYSQILLSAHLQFERPHDLHNHSSTMSFDKKTSEKDFNNFNQDFQDAHVPSPSPPPPPQVPQQEMPYRLPTVQPESVFLSYLPPRRIWIPTPLFVLVFMVFFFESSVLFVYTVVGLFNNLPPTRISMSASDSCNCVPLSEHANSVFNTPVVYVGFIHSEDRRRLTSTGYIEPASTSYSSLNDRADHYHRYCV